MDELEFDSLLLDAQTGEECAWERIYAEMAGTVRGYARRLGASDPDDMVGETFLHLARGIRGFEGNAANFRSWVFTIAHHRVLDERRRQRRKPAHPMSEVPEVTRTFPDATSDEALDLLGTDEVQALIERLVTDQRDVLMLRIVAGFTIAESAEVIGKSIGATKALQRRGVAALKSILHNEGVPPTAAAAVTWTRGNQHDA